MNDLRATIKQSPPIDTSLPYDPSTLAGKVILITGGANGLGSHMVRHWASHGAHVFIGDIDDPAGEALVAELSSKYEKQTFGYRRCDVTVWEDQVKLFEEASRASPSGRINVVVPNAGVLIPSMSLKFENPRLVNGVIPKPNLLQLDVNITGVTYTTHLALYYLPLQPTTGQDATSKAAGSEDRTILLIGSLASVAPLPGQAQYTMSKHAVAGLYRALRATAFPHGIRVNMLAPYYVAETNMLNAFKEALFLAGSAGTASVSDVVDAATRLVADEAVAGRSLMIGPPLKEIPGEEMSKPDGVARATWDCYADDYDTVESFRWRYVRILNAVAQARGTFAWIVDLFSIITRRK